jgi:hypothetical protein
MRFSFFFASLTRRRSCSVCLLRLEDANSPFFSFSHNISKKKENVLRPSVRSSLSFRNRQRKKARDKYMLIESQKENIYISSFYFFVKQRTDKKNKREKESLIILVNSVHCMIHINLSAHFDVKNFLLYT